MPTPGTRVALAGLGLSLGLGLVWGAAGTGCSVGTEPSLLADTDATAAPTPDATPGDADASSLVGTTPPMDQRTYDSTALATFALG